MVSPRLPDDGPVTIGSVRLPEGKRLHGYRHEEPIAWATLTPVPASASVWDALSEMHLQTGLVPIQLDGLDGDPTRPWDVGDFVEAVNPRKADRFDYSSWLKRMWPSEPFPAGDPELIEMWEPFGYHFPGLAPPEHVSLSAGERLQALDSVLPRIRARNGATPSARIALVAADRPADVPSVIGWGGIANQSVRSLPQLTAVLRSWEDRFDARLIDVGFADLRILVGRPPRTLQAAQRIAAEHIQFADECIDALRDIPGVAAKLVNAPIWTFWWD